MAGVRNHGPWAEARRRHRPGLRHFRHALHRDAGGHLYRSRHDGGRPAVATLDQTPLAVAIAGFVLADLAALFASVFKRKRADEALRQTQADLAHVQRVTAMGELAASITHEVMQPLGRE